MNTGSNKRYGHGHGHGAGNDPSHVDARHLTDHTEYRELNFRAIIQFMIVLFAVVGISYVSMYGMMKVFQWEHEENQATLSPVADTAWNVNVKPHVQAAPHVDLTSYQKVQDSIMEGKAAGVSIEEAIRQVAAEGLPYRRGTATTAPATSAGTDTAAGAASVNSPASGSTADTTGR